VRAFVRERLPALADGGDVVETLFKPLPSMVVAHYLGVPEEDRQRVLDFGTAAAPSLDLGLSLREMRRVEAALDDFRRWLVDHLDHLRLHPGDDLLSKLVAVQDEDGGLS
ncbi:MAG: cytochrome P450, partial [Nocardioides sp.]